MTKLYELYKEEAEVETVVLNSDDGSPEALLILSDTGEILERMENPVIFMMGGSGSEDYEEEGEEE